MNAKVKNTWKRCHRGDIGRIVKRLKNRRVARALRRDVTVASFLFAFVISGYVVADTWPEERMDLGGILCYEVSKFKESIVAGNIPPETKACVRRHLSICDHCRKSLAEARMNLHDDRDSDNAESSESDLAHRHIEYGGPSPLFSSLGR